MPYTQGFTVAIERPPYYHPPRSRPVAFESPDSQCNFHHQHHLQQNNQHHQHHHRSLSVSHSRRSAKTHEAANFLRQNLAAYVENNEQQNQHQDYTNTGKMVAMNKQLKSDQLYNNSPRPFVRGGGGLYENGSGGGIDYQQALNTNNVCAGQPERAQVAPPPPRIVVSDHQAVAYPTSTVHKSMLNSSKMVQSSSTSRLDGNGNGNASCDGVNYSRLISPTIMSGSYESLPRTASCNEAEARCAQTTCYDDSTSQQSLLSSLASHRVASTDHHHQSSQDNNRSSASNNNNNNNNQARLSVGEQRSATATSNEQATSVSSPMSRSSAGGEATIAGAASTCAAPLIGSVASGGNGAGGGAGALIDFDYIHKRLPCSAGSGTGLTMQSGLARGSSNSVGGGSTVVPDSKRDEYMWNRQLERVSIAHQTYRTLPIVMPKPKAHHDLATGSYMSYSQDPTWELLTRSRSSSLANRDHERKIRQAIRSEMATLQPQSNYAAKTTTSMDDSSVPVFNYRQYIESTRRAY